MITKAKRLGFQSVVVHFGLFDYEIQCIVGPRDNLVEYIRWAMDEPDFQYEVGRKLGAHFMRRGYASIIWMPRKPRTPKEHGTLAHEMLHAVREMLVNWAGMELCFDTDEVFCHSIGHGVQTVLTGLK